MSESKEEDTRPQLSIQTHFERVVKGRRYSRRRAPDRARYVFTASVERPPGKRLYVDDPTYWREPPAPSMGVFEDGVRMKHFNTWVKYYMSPVDKEVAKRHFLEHLRYYDASPTPDIQRKGILDESLPEEIKEQFK